MKLEPPKDCTPRWRRRSRDGGGGGRGGRAAACACPAAFPSGLAAATASSRAMGDAPQSAAAAPLDAGLGPALPRGAGSSAAAQDELFLIKGAGPPRSGGDRWREGAGPGWPRPRTRARRGAPGAAPAPPGRGPAPAAPGALRGGPGSSPAGHAWSSSSSAEGRS